MPSRACGIQGRKIAWSKGRCTCLSSWWPSVAFPVVPLQPRWIRRNNLLRNANRSLCSVKEYKESYHNYGNKCRRSVHRCGKRSVVCQSCGSTCWIWGISVKETRSNINDDLDSHYVFPARFFIQVKKFKRPQNRISNFQLPGFQHATARALDICLAYGEEVL